MSRTTRKRSRYPDKGGATDTDRYGIEYEQTTARRNTLREVIADATSLKYDRDRTRAGDDARFRTADLWVLVQDLDAGDVTFARDRSQPIELLNEAVDGLEARPKRFLTAPTLVRLAEAVGAVVEADALAYAEPIRCWTPDGEALCRGAVSGVRELEHGPPEVNVLVRDSHTRAMRGVRYEPIPADALGWDPSERLTDGDDDWTIGGDA